MLKVELAGSDIGCRWTSLYSSDGLMWDYAGGIASIVASSGLDTGCVALESGERSILPCSQVRVDSKL